MPRLLLPLTLLAAATAALSQSPSAPATPPTGPTPERHEFILHNFHTESGAILPEAHIVYGTYGTLNADRSNAILLPSHYMANLTGYGFLIKSPTLPRRSPGHHQTVSSNFRALRQRPQLLPL